MLCLNERNQEHLDTRRKSICARTGSQFNALDFSRQTTLTGKTYLTWRFHSVLGTGRSTLNRSSEMNMAESTLRM